MSAPNERVLVIGSRSAHLSGRLSALGYRCARAATAAELKTVEPPSVVVLAASARQAPSLLTQLRRRAEFRRVPVLIDGTEGWRASLQRLDVDGVAESMESLDQLLRSALKAREAVALDSLVRRRLELMLELARLSLSGVAAEELLRTVPQRLADDLGGDGVEVLKLADVPPTVLAAQVPQQEDGAWVVPVNTGLPMIAALRVRRRQAFAQEELDYLQGVAVALGNAVEQRRVSATAAKSQQALEDAYVERFRELVEANNRLRAADRKKNEIMAVLSHDLRAPLGVVLGHAHILQHDSALSAAAHVSADAIARAGKKALGLVESLLDSARGNDGRMVLFSRPFDVAQTCHDAARELQLLAKEQGVKLRAEAPLSLDVFADEQKIRQVLQNLITNALKHAQQATEITVRARLRRRPDGDVALVEVRDDGVVTEPERVLMAFERSSGLGLSICRDFVERHGGELWAEAPEGRGAVFAFTLPLPRGMATQTPAPQRQEPLVLLVDDDPIFSHSMSVGLAGRYRVELARDGDAAVERARALLPDVVVMDVFMPRRDGLDALRELQAGAETAHIPVILLSARPELPQRVRPQELGAADFLPKPAPPEVLASAVAKAIAARRAPEQRAEPPALIAALEQERARAKRYGRPCTVAVLKPLAVTQADPGRCVELVRAQLAPPEFAGHLGGGVLVAVLPELDGDAARALVSKLTGLLADEGVACRSRTLDAQALPESGVAAWLEEAV